MTQLYLFDEQPERQRPLTHNNTPSAQRFEGAVLYSAIGDALAWPTEFINPQGKRKPDFSLPVQNFITWKKLVGGKWWGYEEQIEPGAYSDDTQLALAVARCISESGRFEPERFAYEELPLWLQYERGGGKSVKTAARKLIGKRAHWLQNFYKQGDLSYKDAGANGAAMRNLPIALVHVHDKQLLIKDSFYNAIITHGHPRAIVGTILFGLAVHCALTLSSAPSPEELIECVLEGLQQIKPIIKSDEHLSAWVQHWNQSQRSGEMTFGNMLKQTLQETQNYLQQIPPHLPKEAVEYYTLVGALDPATKGSGIATVCAAIYLFLKYLEQPEQAILTSTNTFGSDTDTIGVFLGALLGAYHGLQVIPERFAERVQDRDFLIQTARRLHSIAAGEEQDFIALNHIVEREEAYLRILSWEIALHEMFWDVEKEGDTILHPALGRGTITAREEKPIKRDGYVAKLIRVAFDCGQSCVFHSRVEHNEKISESLALEITSALQ